MPIQKDDLVEAPWLGGETST